MGPLPDISGIFWFGFFGMVCAALLVAGGGGWLAYHLIMALRLYILGG